MDATRENRSKGSLAAVGAGTVVMAVVVGLAAACGSQGDHGPGTSTTSPTPTTTPSPTTVPSPATSAPPPAENKIDPRGGNKFEPGTHAEPGHAPRHRHPNGSFGGEGDGGDGGGGDGGGGE